MSRPNIRSRLSSLAAEPLIHFVALAAALFAANYVFEPRERETIAVTSSIVDELVRRGEALQSAPLSNERRESVISAFIDNEILVREAYRRGLDRDAYVRQHLIMKMRTLLAEDVGEPTHEQLLGYFDENREKYRLAPTVMLEHVYYPSGVAPEKGLLLKLSEGADPARFGEPLGTLGRAARTYSQQDIAFFTDAQFAQRVFELPVDLWSGPINSRRGTHFVRVVQKSQTGYADFDDLQDYLSEQWKYSQARDGLLKKIKQLRQEYHIVVDEASEFSTP